MNDPIVYPPNCQELAEDLSKEELIRRLKAIQSYFQQVDQFTQNKYEALSRHLASEFFLEHPSRDVRMLSACCLADLFRILAPEPPFYDHGLLKQVFSFFARELSGLREPDSAAFSKHFYLLENLAVLRTFILCLEIPDGMDVIALLFKNLLEAASERLPEKAKQLSIQLMTGILYEADNLTQEVLDLLLSHVIPPLKNQRKEAYRLAVQVIQKSANSLEKPVTDFLHSVLVEGHRSHSELAEDPNPLLFELQTIAPSLLAPVLPQLEFKLKSTDERERKEVCRLLADIFSAEPLDQKPLWLAFLGRFRDRCIDVRKLCVHSAGTIWKAQPHLRADLEAELIARATDPDEGVRVEVVLTVVNSLRRESPSEGLFRLLAERTLDRKFRVRKESLQGLCALYRASGTSAAESEPYKQIPSLLLHVYYIDSVADHALVEQLLGVHMVPWQSEADERAQALTALWRSLDRRARDAFDDLLRCKQHLREELRQWIAAPSSRGDRMALLARSLESSLRPLPHLRSLGERLTSDSALKRLFSLFLDAPTCSKRADCVRQILQKIGQPTPGNGLYWLTRQLLERASQLLVDRDAALALPSCDEPALLPRLAELEPDAFQQEALLEALLPWLDMGGAHSEAALRVLRIAAMPFERALPAVKKLALEGSKWAVRTLATLAPTELAHLLPEWESRAATKPDALGAIAAAILEQPAELEVSVRHCITDVVVQRLLGGEWPGVAPITQSSLSSPSPRCHLLLAGIKLLSAWLRSAPRPMAPLRLLLCILERGGGVADAESAPWLRLKAGVAVLKICACGHYRYPKLLTPAEFRLVAMLMADPCLEVRRRFASKLNRQMVSLRLPLPFMSAFALTGVERDRPLRNQIREMLHTNCQRRRELLRQGELTEEKRDAILPLHCFQFAIHLLAHDPALTSWTDAEAMQNSRECLWFLMEPLLQDELGFSYLKRLAESIKIRVDAEDTAFSEKIYGLCDLSLNLLLSRGAHCLLRDLPKEPLIINTMFKMHPDPNFVNSKVYLPLELTIKRKEAPVKEAEESVSDNDEQSMMLTNLDDEEVTPRREVPEKKTKKKAADEDEKTPRKAKKKPVVHDDESGSAAKESVRRSSRRKVEPQSSEEEKSSEEKESSEDEEEEKEKASPPVRRASKRRKK